MVPSEVEGRKMEVENTNPTPTVTNVVYLSDDQFTVLMDQGNAIQSNQGYLFILLAVLIGVLVMQSFWTGWRSSK